MSSEDRGIGPRTWRTPDALHIDLRGLEPPEPMVMILRMLDGGEADGPLVAHLDREPIFLYPELDDRGWNHEIVSSARTGHAARDDVVLRLTRRSE